VSLEELTEPTMNNIYELEHPSVFNFLNKSDVYTIPVRDEAGYDKTVKAMELIQFSKVEIESVFAIVAAIGKCEYSRKGV
jgi:myosin heavy subunit